MVTAEAWYWLWLYRYYQQGHLLIAGGVLDQPSYYLAMMELIASWDFKKD